MVVYSVGKTSEFIDSKPLYVDMPGRKTKIAVYRLRDRYYAYLDLCPHQGGPACEGIVIGNVEAEILRNGAEVRKYTSEERYNIACPWHGVEFDLTTGVCRANSKDRLMSYEVFVENGEVKVKT
ncbi:MAG: Rieske (2Fe-2S) protein [Nitrososphaerales archaeon]